MKRQISKMMLFVSFTIMMTGCNAQQEKDSFYTDSNGDIIFGQAPKDWSVEIALIIIFLIVLVYSIFLVRRNLRYKNKANWEKTTASFTGVSNTYMASKHRNGYYSIPEPKMEYQIEYWADGKRYERYIGEKEMDDCTREEIEIEYFRKRPTIFRIL